MYETLGTMDLLLRSNDPWSKALLDYFLPQVLPDIPRATAL